MKDAATKPRRLRGGRSLWADTPRVRPRFRRKLGSVECDVVIVGAGVSGALAALALTESGNKVAVLDRRPPVTGSTLEFVAAGARQISNRDSTPLPPGLDMETKASILA